MRFLTNYVGLTLGRISLSPRHTCGGRERAACDGSWFPLRMDRRMGAGSGFVFTVATVKQSGCFLVAPHSQPRGEPAASSTRGSDQGFPFVWLSATMSAWSEVYCGD
jgi:hypothetical protein